MRYVLIVFFLVFAYFKCKAQEPLVDSSGIRLLMDVKSFAMSEFHMKGIDNYYYKHWVGNDLPNLYLYVALKDSIGSAINRNFIGYGTNNSNDAIQKKFYFDSLGYPTILYKTYGTSGTMLSNHLLNYNKPSIAFIGFHEATHQQLSKISRLPYVFVEALCDVMGVQGTLAFAKSNRIGLKEAEKFCIKLELLATQINDCIISFENKNDNFDSYRSQLLENINSIDETEQFLIERYNYELNNAYLLRNKSYTLYYFKLKELLELKGDYKLFWEFIASLSNNGIDTLSQIDLEIGRLKP